MQQIDSLNKSIKQNPLVSKNYIDLGILLRNDSIIRKGISLDTNNYFGYYGLAFIWQTDTTKSLDSVLFFINKSIQLKSNFVEAYWVKTYVCRKLNDLDCAIKSTKTAASLSSPNDYCFQLYSLYKEKGEYTAAINAINPKIDFKESLFYYNVFYRIQINLWHLKKYDLAISDCDSAILCAKQWYKNDLVKLELVNFYKGAAFYLKGQKEKALELLNLSTVAGHCCDNGIDTFLKTLATEYPDNIIVLKLTEQRKKYCPDYECWLKMNRN